MIELDSSGAALAGSPALFSDCSHGTELVWNSNTGEWMSYAASSSPIQFGTAVDDIFRCTLP
jgi:hypothetical protein